MSSRGRGETAAPEKGVATLAREFAFPREAVFRMFTDPKEAAKWFGSPEGAVTLLFEFDARPGGTIRIHDRPPGGPVHRTIGTVLEIVDPERIAFRTRTTPEGGTSSFEALQTVTLEEIGRARTRLTVVVKVLSAGAFPGGVEALVEGFRGGWGETLDKLQREMR